MNEQTTERTPNPEMRHTDDMGEISGFGGGYENACQNMLQAGIEFINEKKVAGGDLKAHTYNNVYGLFFADNNVTQELEDHVVASEKGCSGAMCQAVMSRLMYIANNGWEKYCEECRKAHAEEKASQAEAAAKGLPDSEGGEA